ncbi:MAG: hypothetical protein ACTSRF_16275 [Candidatus Freyarchaeota archaeon]
MKISKANWPEIMKFKKVEVFEENQRESAEILGEPSPIIEGNWFICMGETSDDLFVGAKRYRVLVLNKDKLNFLLKEFGMRRV